MTQNYKIHGNTIFIKNNGVIGHYLLHGNKVKKIVNHSDGNEYVDDFHTIGELPLNSEAILLNKLRERGEL